MAQVCGDSWTRCLGSGGRHGRGRRAWSVPTSAPSGRFLSGSSQESPRSSSPTHPVSGQTKRNYITWNLVFSSTVAGSDMEVWKTAAQKLNCWQWQSAIKGACFFLSKPKATETKQLQTQVRSSATSEIRTQRLRKGTALGSSVTSLLTHLFNTDLGPCGHCARSQRLSSWLTRQGWLLPSRRTRFSEEYWACCHL